MNNTFLAIDIGSSTITAVIAKHDLENNINILGTGIQKSGGINKGLIINIEEASKSIKDAVSIAKRTTTELIDTTVVSISGSYSKSIRSSGSVNVPNGLITETEINQVMHALKGILLLKWTRASTLLKMAHKIKYLKSLVF